MKIEKLRLPISNLFFYTPLSNNNILICKDKLNNWNILSKNNINDIIKNEVKLWKRSVKLKEK